MAGLVEAYRVAIWLVVCIWVLAVAYYAGVATKEFASGGLIVVGIGSVSLILTVGVSAVLLRIVDLLEEIRGLLGQDGGARSGPTNPSNQAAAIRHRLAGPGVQVTGSGRRKVKAYKGQLIERDEDGNIYVGGQRFDGVIAAEKHIDQKT